MKTLLFLMLFTFSHTVFAQITSSSSVYISGNVYNKQTGQKLTEEETNNLIKEYPGIIFERVYDKYGSLEKLLFDPGNILTGKVMFRNEENQIKPGELFPEFVFKTIDGEKVDSKNLQDSWVLLRFELLSIMINQEEITSLEKQIDEFKLENKLTAVILLNDTKTNIKQNVKPMDSVFKIVADGRNFHERFNITKFPTTILIDKNGVVHGYYYRNEQIDFSKLKTNDNR
jgi:peroxiredoxin